MEWLCMISLLAYCLYLGFRIDRLERKIGKRIKQRKNDRRK